MKRRAIAWLALMALLPLTAILVVTFFQTREQRTTATVVAVAARQQALSERYLQEVLLTSEGRVADPAETVKSLRLANLAMLNGGTVQSLSGSPDDAIEISGTDDREIKQKLLGAAKLVRQLEVDGNAFLTMPKADLRAEATLLKLRITSAEMESTTRDIAGAVIRSSRERVDALTALETMFGGIGVLGAVVMSLFMLRRGKRSETNRFESLVTHSSDLVVTTDARGVMTYVSPSAKQFLGVVPSEVIGRSLRDFLHEDDVDEVLSTFVALAIRAGDTARIQCRVAHQSGRWVTTEAVLTNLLDDDTVRGIVFNGRDITAQEALVDKLEHKAFHDDLTRLANRSLLMDRLNHAIIRARRSGSAVSVLLCDLDNFKMINDTLGHLAGDEVLVEVAQRLQSSVREGDTIARLGGDEFAIVCEDVCDGDDESVAQRVLDALRPPFLVSEREVFISASIGISSNATEVAEAEDLLSGADIAMYAAKVDGRDRFRRFEYAMQAALSQRHDLEHDLRNAVANRELIVHYQPLFDLHDDRVVSIEALLRWNHPTRGLVSPLEFIPIAEESGLIASIGLHVLETACVAALPWQKFGPIPIAVNVAASQLHDPAFIDQVGDIFRRVGCDPQNVTLELTESTLISDVAETIERLTALKGLGVNIAIDDFGTGYSSLAYLRDFPVDYLKIDRAFVAEIGGHRHEQGLALIDAIVGLAHTLKLDVVAEGIENNEQRNYLLSSGCNIGQGFLFSRPLTEDAIADFIATHLPSREMRPAA